MDKHKVKQKIARKLRTKDEIKARTPIFQSKAWDKRAEVIADRVKRKNNKLKNKKGRKV